jgi:hypothetical protein
MIASKQGNSVFVPHFESKKKKESLDTVSSSVYVVTKKDIVGVGRVSAYFE